MMSGTLTATNVVNMDSMSTGTITGLNSTSFTLYSSPDNYFLRFTGNYSVASGTLNSGTVTGISIYYQDADERNSLWGTVTGLSVDAAVAYDYADLGEWDNLWSFVFSSDNTFNGSAGNDLLAGYGGNDKLYGNAGNDSLDGGDGDDTLDGGVGRDSLTGGTGHDVYYVDRTLDQVVEVLNEGVDTVFATASYTLSEHVEKLTLIGTATIHGTGNDLANTLTGNSAANVLTGGAGDDLYYVGAGDTVKEDFDAGTDAVYSEADWTLAENVEALVLTGSANVNGTGNGLSNTLTGNTGANSLSGVGGNDTLDGAAGNDNLDGGAGNDSLIGNAGNDSLDGQVGMDVLVGGAGLDTLVGWVGNDTLRGGGGNDKIYGDEAPGQTLPTFESLVPATHASVTGLASNVFGAYGEVANDPLELGEVILGETSGVTLQSATYTGATRASSLFSAVDLGGSGFFKLGQGILLTSGDGTPSLSNTSTGYTQVNNAPGDANLDGVASAAFPGAGNTEDAVVLELKFTATGGTKLSLDLMFGSDEYPEYSNSSFVDIAAVEIDGVNYALFNNDPTQPLSVIDQNLGVGNFYDNRGGTMNIEYDGISAPLRVVGDLKADVTEHTIRIAIADTGDKLLDSGIFLSNLKVRDSSYDSGIAVLTGFNDMLFGDAGKDTLVGGIGNDTLNGGADADSLSGGQDDDSYLVDNAGDVVTEAAGQGTDSVKSSVAYTLTANVEHLTLTGGSALAATGNDLNNLIEGNLGNNQLKGLAGADTLEGGRGDDTLDGGAGNDTASYASATKMVVVNLNVTGSQDTRGAGTDALISIENLIGGAGNDALFGNSGNNALDGGAGGDTMRGGAGDDSYFVDDSLDEVHEAANKGTDLVNASVDYTLGANVERLLLTGGEDINGIGNGLNNEITGNLGNNQLNGESGDDSLDGGLGTDTMVGGEGDDTYFVEAHDDQVVEALDEGTDIVRASIDYMLGADVENLTLTGSESLSGTGNGLGNVIVGNVGANELVGEEGDDTLEGGLGDDTLDGGSGNDTVSYGSMTAAVKVDLSLAGPQNTLTAGTDTLMNIEHVIGGTGADVLLGNTGNNMLDGGAGKDSMSGGQGDDSYLVDNAGDVVAEAAGEGTDSVKSSVAYTLTANVEHLTLTGGSDLSGTGNGLGNLIVGNLGNNQLKGLAGADTLEGGRGNDTLNGGGGNDTASYASATNKVVVDLSLAGAQNTRGAGTDTLVDMENVIGGAGNDALFGNSGNNVLDGGAGGDTMRGGAGNDTYVVDTYELGKPSDRPSELQNEGTDTILSSINWSLRGIFNNIENLTLTGTDDIDATGNNPNTGGSGHNVLIGNVGNNFLVGLNGNDTLDGGAGDDVLMGGAGVDALTGGDGRDIFVFDTALGQVDVITDFDVADDLIGLDSAIYNTLGVLLAPAITASVQTSLCEPIDYTLSDTNCIDEDTLVIGAAAGDVNDYLIYDNATGALYYDADGNNAGVAVQFAMLDIGLQLTTANFVLV